MNRNTVGAVVLAALCVWALYLSIEVARHVGAWPFG